MNRIKYNVIISVFFLFLVLVCACRRGQGSNSDKGTSDIVIPLDMNNPYYVDKFSNIFSEVRYVVLEETRNSVIGTVSRLEITNSGDFIVFDAQAGAVFRFASDGRFLNNVGFRGAGENEYVFPEDMKYDSFKNAVLVVDAGKRAILTYAVDGKLISTTHLPWAIGAVGVLDDKYLICYMNNDEDVVGDEKGTNYKVITRDGLVVNEFGEFDAEISSFRPSAEHVFCYQGGHCLCMPPYSYTLYEARPDSLKALVTFDLSENAIPEEWKKGEFAQFYEKLKGHRDLVEINGVYENDNCYFLNLVRGQFPLICILKKDNGQIQSISTRLINDIYGLVEEPVITDVKDDKLYFVIEPQSFEDELSLLSQYQDDARGVVARKKAVQYAVTASLFGSEAAKAYVDSLESSQFCLVPGEREMVEEMSKKSNPIIQICTLKK